ncbi:MAG TPA: dihydrofolate reductase family protein [Limnochorda sp.]
MFRLYPSPAEVEAPHTIYDDITFPPPPPGRPYTWINMVATLDGRVTLGRGRIRTPLGSKLDRVLMSRLRFHADAVLQGAGTVRDAGYFPRVPDDLRARRRAAGRQEHPVPVVITASCELPLEAPFFAQAPRRALVLTTARAARDRVEAARAVADVVVLGEERVELAEAMAYLRQERGVAYLLSEGGPSLNYSLFAEGLADELFLTVAPRIGGYRADLTAVDGPAVLEPMPELEPVSLHMHERELFLRYRRVGGPGRGGR